MAAAADAFKKHGVLVRSIGFKEDTSGDDRRWEYAALEMPQSKHFKGPKLHDNNYHARPKLYHHIENEKDLKVIEDQKKQKEYMKEWFAINSTRWEDDAPGRRKRAEERLERDMTILQRETAFKRLWDGPSQNRAPKLTAMFFSNFLSNFG